jgi:hypothetical protein
MAFSSSDYFLLDNALWFGVNVGKWMFVMCMSLQRKYIFMILCRLWEFTGLLQPMHSIFVRNGLHDIMQILPFAIMDRTVSLHGKALSSYTQSAVTILLVWEILRWKMNLITSKFMSLIEFWPFLCHKQNISMQLEQFTLNVFCYLLNLISEAELIMPFLHVVSENLPDHMRFHP